mgnify:CR=1 FL=1
MHIRYFLVRRTIRCQTHIPPRVSGLPSTPRACNCAFRHRQSANSHRFHFTLSTPNFSRIIAAMSDINHDRQIPFHPALLQYITQFRISKIEKYGKSKQQSDIFSDQKTAYAKLRSPLVYTYAVIFLLCFILLSQLPASRLQSQALRAALHQRYSAPHSSGRKHPLPSGMR